MEILLFIVGILLLFNRLQISKKYKLSNSNARLLGVIAIFPMACLLFGQIIWIFSIDKLENVGFMISSIPYTLSSYIFPILIIGYFYFREKVSLS